MTSIDSLDQMLPFSERFRIAGQRFDRRPLAEQLSLLVQIGAITEEDRQRAIQREVSGRGARKKRNGRHRR
ncbi:MAG TPA: hypothetical protein VH253_18620 [Phycisphaerae bacterium]|nr:hypothetical protein [Phycisphaerae bacterium]